MFPCTFVREEIVNYLINKLPSGVYLDSCEFEQYFESQDKISVQLKDGRTFDADILIGADGLKSQVRSQMTNNLNDTLETHSFTFACVGPQLSENPSDKGTPNQISGNVTFFMRKGMTMGTYSAGTHQIFFLTFSTKIYPENKEWLQDHTLEERKSFIKNLIGDIAPFPLRLVENLTRIVPLKFYCKPPLKNQWHKGRVVLIGDAAHTMLPHSAQGANQAIIDSLALATEISNCGGDYESAFNKYHNRAELVEEVHSRGLFIKNVESFPLPLRYLLSRISKMTNGFQFVDRLESYVFRSIHYMEGFNRYPFNHPVQYYQKMYEEKKQKGSFKRRVFLIVIGAAVVTSFVIWKRKTIF